MTNIDQLLDALGDATRRSIIDQLTEGAKAVGEIASSLPVSRPAVSQHLKVLREAGLVADKAVGTRRIYRLEPQSIELLQKYLTEKAPDDRNSRAISGSALQVTATDLDAWSHRRSSQDQLPALLRSLIFALNPPPRSIRMVSGEGVQSGGWDGLVESDGSPPFVPPGTSGWEISVRADIRQKANEDYEKRVENPRELEPAETTFVFATARVWPEKDDWAAEKKAEGIWRDVQTIDAHALESWLENAPGAHLRISELLGRKPPGVTDLVTAWEELEGSTNPPLSKNLILGGREEPAAQIREMLTKDRDVISIAADSREEALAFFAASLEALDRIERGSLRARTIVVWDSTRWRDLVARPENLVLIPMFDDRKNVGGATRNNHRVVVPLGREVGSQSDSAVDIGRPRRDALRKELESLGISRHRAADLAGIGRRSLLSLKRQIAKAKDVERPPWASPAHASDLLPAMFAGSWVEGNEKDHTALERLSDCPYREWARVVQRWANESDPPVRQIGDVWVLVSKEDAWTLLRGAISRHDLEALQEVSLDVFEWIDTSYDLPPEEQWSAGLFKDTAEYSGKLRKGLADTLALLGARSDASDLPGGSGQDWASRIVREVFERADEDWRRWATLADVLPLLAEAAPDQFLSAVERGIREGNSNLENLFRDQDSAMWSRSPHTYLLWALERLAWSPTHLPRAALALARLDSIDPGGTTTSRPFDSLSRIFLVVRPHTAADAETRQAVLDTLIKREPDVGWRLLLELVPDHHMTFTSTSRPTRREWAPDEDVSATWGEIFAQLDAVIDLALVEAGDDGARWAELVEVVDRLRRETADQILNAVEELGPDSIETDGRRAILDALRNLVSRHRKFTEADWALPDEVVDRLDAVYQRFEFDDPVERHRWLFSESPALMDLEEHDIRREQNILHEKRADAARAVYEIRGLSGLLSLAEGAERALDLGSTLGLEDIIPEEDVFALLDQGLGSDHEVADVARGFTRAVASRRGSQWLREVLESEHGSQWVAEEKADLLLASPDARGTWPLVEEAGKEVAELYWSRARPYGLRERDLAEQAAEKLLEHGRPYSAIMTLALALDEEGEAPSWEIAVRALEEAPSVNPEDDPTPSSLSYHVEQLLDQLTESGAVPNEKLAELEWIWLKVLDHTDRSATVLHRELSRNPSFFAEVVSLIYEPDEAEDREGSEDDVVRARQASRLLDSWDSVPGTDGDGALSGEQLEEWVDGALEATRESGRGEIGKYVIGQVLARSPNGRDGHWPHETVRKVVEALESDTLERGMQNGLYNSRGVTTRGPYDGGDQERALAERYEANADALMGRTPRTAAMLRRIAATFRRDAEREDQSAELLEDLGG